MTVPIRIVFGLGDPTLSRNTAVACNVGHGRLGHEDVGEEVGCRVWTLQAPNHLLIYTDGSLRSRLS